MTRPSIQLCEDSIIWSSWLPGTVPKLLPPLFALKIIVKESPRLWKGNADSLLPVTQTLWTSIPLLMMMMMEVDQRDREHAELWWRSCQSRKWRKKVISIDWEVRMYVISIKLIIYEEKPGSDCRPRSVLLRLFLYRLFLKPWEFLVISECKQVTSIAGL